MPELVTGLWGGVGQGLVSLKERVILCLGCRAGSTCEMEVLSRGGHVSLEPPGLKRRDFPTTSFVLGSAALHIQKFPATASF